MNKWIPPARWAYQVAKDVLTRNGHRIDIPTDDAIQNVLTCIALRAPDYESLAVALERLTKWCDENLNGSPHEYSEIMFACEAALKAYRAARPAHDSTVPSLGD